MAMGKMVRAPRPLGPALSKRQFRAVTKLINKGKELHTYQYYVDANVPNTKTLVELTDITIGSQYYMRDDCNTITVRAIKGHVGIAGADSSNRMRVIIARSKDGPLYTTDFPAIGAQPDLDKMQVYWDRTFLVSQYGPYFLSNIPVNIKLAKGKIPGVNVRYDGTTSTSAISGGIYLYYISDSAAASDPLLISHLNIKFYEKD